MALVIEDGTIVAGANSYQSVADIRAYADARGIVLDASDTVVESQAHEAMMYLESLSYKGQRVKPQEQSLSWPRCGVRYDGVTVPDNVIPNNLKYAQCQVVAEIASGVDIWASTSAASADAQRVKREKVDVLETEYMTPQEMGVGDAGSSGVATMPAVDALLRPLLNKIVPTLSYRI